MPIQGLCKGHLFCYKVNESLGCQGGEKTGRLRQEALASFRDSSRHTAGCCLQPAGRTGLGHPIWSQCPGDRWAGVAKVALPGATPSQ